jgi:hypothetical protein
MTDRSSSPPESDVQEPDRPPAPLHRHFTGTEGVGPLSSRAIAFYAVLVAAAGFVPIPILDDLLPRQLVRLMIRAILRQAGRRYSIALVKPLFAGDGCLAGVLGALLMLPVDILLYPVRKFVRVIKGVRGLSARLVSTYLLGHTVNRYVQKDWLAPDCDPLALHFQALMLREGCEVSLKVTNPVVFASSVASILGGLRGLPRAAWKTARALLRQQRLESTSGPQPAAGPPSAARVEGAAEQVEQALDDPKVQAFLAEFDEVVDREVERLIAEAAAEKNAKPGS